MSAFRDFCRCRTDRLGDVGIEQTQLAVRVGGGLLDQRQRPDETPGETLAGDRKIQDGALG